GSVTCPRGCGKPIDPTTAASPSCTSATKAYVWGALECIPRTGRLRPKPSRRQPPASRLSPRQERDVWGSGTVWLLQREAAMDASLVTHNHATARAMPRVAELYSTWCLLREGYTFLPNRQQALQSDVFELRLLGKRTIALSGAAAAALFYDENHFIRRKALPLRVRRTLTGMGAVQGLDGTAHRQRKALFMQLVDETQLRRLVVHAQEEWQSATEQWQTQERVVLHDEAQEILARAVCRWAGMPLREREVKRRVGQ